MGGGVSKHNVVVIGLDGSGKSTAVEALSPNSNKKKTTAVPPTCDGIRYAEAHWSEQVCGLSTTFRGLPNTHFPAAVANMGPFRPAKV